MMICPVCYHDMQSEPAHNAICDGCGTEFGFDDHSKTHAELRAEWVAGGSEYWGDGIPDHVRPAVWPPICKY